MEPARRWNHDADFERERVAEGPPGGQRKKGRADAKVRSPGLAGRTHRERSMSMAAYGMWMAGRLFASSASPHRGPDSAVLSPNRGRPAPLPACLVSMCRAVQLWASDPVRGPPTPEPPTRTCIRNRCAARRGTARERCSDAPSNRFRRARSLCASPRAALAGSTRVGARELAQASAAVERAAVPGFGPRSTDGTPTTT
jgi:hypothetical protein